MEKKLIEAIATQDVVLAESIRRKAKQMRADLSTGKTPATEKLLIDDVVISFLETQYNRMGVVRESERRGDADFWAKNLDRANARHLKAIDQLTRIRGLSGSKDAKRGAILKSTRDPLKDKL